MSQIVVIVNIQVINIRVNEVFQSLEGESIDLGVPTIFIRFTGCNLACNFCDSKYAMNEGKDYKITQLLKEVKKYKSKRVSLSGGCPLLQQDEIGKFLQMLSSRYYINVETNGTIVPNKDMQQRVDTWNVSIKLSNSDNPTNKRIVPQAIEWFVNNNHCYFKFVIKTQKDLKEMEELIEKFDIPKNKIIIMPEGITVDSMRNKLWLVDYCKENNIRYTPRLQILLFGNRRGV